jgi:hypothetical protein
MLLKGLYRAKFYQKVGKKVSKITTSINDYYNAIIRGTQIPGTRSH